MNDDKPVDISGGWVTRVMRVVRWAEQWTGQGPPPSVDGQILPPPPWFYGKLQADLAAGASEPVKCRRWYRDPDDKTWKATTGDDELYDVLPSPQLLTGQIAAGKWVKVDWEQKSQARFVTEWTC